MHFWGSKNALGKCRQLSTIDSDFSFSLANQHGKLAIGTMLIHICLVKEEPWIKIQSARLLKYRWLVSYRCVLTALKNAYDNSPIKERMEPDSAAPCVDYTRKHLAMHSWGSKNALQTAFNNWLRIFIFFGKLARKISNRYHVNICLAKEEPWIKIKSARLLKCGWLGGSQMVSYRCAITALKTAYDAYDNSPSKVRMIFSKLSEMHID